MLFSQSHSSQSWPVDLRDYIDRDFWKSPEIIIGSYRGLNGNTMQLSTGLGSTELNQFRNLQHGCVCSLRRTVLCGMWYACKVCRNSGYSFIHTPLSFTHIMSLRMCSMTFLEMQMVMCCIYYTTQILVKIIISQHFWEMLDQHDPGRENLPWVMWKKEQGSGLCDVTSYRAVHTKDNNYKKLF